MRFVCFLLIFSLAFIQNANAQLDVAQKFGARESIQNISISPDGMRVAYIEPGVKAASNLFVAGIEGAPPKQILTSDGAPLQLRWCDWASNDRLVCKLYGIVNNAGTLVGFTRMIALNADGSELKALGQKSSSRTQGSIYGDGDIMGWNQNGDGSVLLSREYLGETTINTRLANTEKGLGVDRINTLTLKTERVETPRETASDYLADTSGTVRIMETQDTSGSGYLRGTTRYFYRLAGDRDWKSFSTVTDAERSFSPIAVDSKRNIAYSIASKDGRSAIYTVSLDETLTKTLLLAHDKVDVSNLLTLGRTGRVIGAEYVTDRRETVLFDTEYKALAAKLGKALPGLPLVQFVGASGDESRLLLFAGSDTDPGRYYVYDKPAKRLIEIALARPELEATGLSSVRTVSYPAKDGTLIPGYLTLPPGSDGRGLPALVIPHGGPSARDEWGFDWLAQFYAAQGFAVLQPNFRGSAGYGDSWYINNGFKSWRIAIGDVNDAGRWLVSQGIADPDKLAIVGWSYGGYAALQSGVVEPDLFKAVVAIAPVVDLKLLIEQSREFTNFKLVEAFVGSGEHIQSGSPLQQISRLKAPILLFSGDFDTNVNINQAKAMSSALRKIGKAGDLITYQGLDHQLSSSAARTDMLQRSVNFLRGELHLK